MLSLYCLKGDDETKMKDRVTQLFSSKSYKFINTGLDDYINDRNIYNYKHGGAGLKFD